MLGNTALHHSHTPFPLPSLLSLHCLPASPSALHPGPLTYTYCHCGILPPALAHAPCVPALTVKRRLWDKTQNKWWSAVQLVGSSSFLSMDDWTEPEGKCVSEAAVLPNESTWTVLITAQYKQCPKAAAHIQMSARARERTNCVWTADAVNKSPLRHLWYDMMHMQNELHYHWVSAK